MAASQVLRKSSAMGPSVRNLLSQYKIEASQVVSTGPHQTLLKSDVLSYINQRNLAPQLNHQAHKNTQSSMSATIAGARLQDRAITSTHMKYRRRQLEPLEIEVINNGGFFDPPPVEAKPKKR